MNEIFRKLNFKDGPAAYVINSPGSFHSALDEMRGVTGVHENFEGAKAVTFALAFASKKSDVDKFADQIAKTSSGDAVVWVAYPKRSSKKYICEFNRDKGWDRFAAHGFEPVRMVAIDADWSALRFRRVEHIKTMTRRSALTKAGRKRLKERASNTGTKA